MPERKARNRTTQKGRQQQLPPGKDGGREARNRSEPPTETRPWKRTQKQEQAEEETAEETARRIATRQDEVSETQSKPQWPEPKAGHKRPREDPEEEKRGQRTRGRAKKKENMLTARKERSKNETTACNRKSGTKPTKDEGRGRNLRNIKKKKKKKKKREISGKTRNPA